MKQDYETLNLDFAAAPQTPPGGSYAAPPPAPTTETAPAPQDPPTPAPVPASGNPGNILDDTICLQLSFGSFGTMRKVPIKKIQTDAEKDLLRLSKKIIESKRLDDIHKADGALKDWIVSQSVPSPFGKSFYLIRAARFDRIMERIDQYRPERERMARAFVDLDYSDARRDMKTRLGSLFDERNYPPNDEVLARFTMDARPLEFSTPGNLRTLNRARWETESANFKRDIANAGEKIRTLLRVQMQELLNKAVERLTPTAAGERKIFRDTLIGNITDFLETFQDRNLSDDRELAAIVAQVDGLLKGVTPDALRNSDRIAETVRTKMETANVALSGMVTDAGRRIRFED